MNAEQILFRMRYSWEKMYLLDKCTDTEYYTALGDLTWLAEHHGLPELVELLAMDYQDYFEE